MSNGTDDKRKLLEILIDHEVDIISNSYKYRELEISCATVSKIPERDYYTFAFSPDEGLERPPLYVLGATPEEIVEVVVVAGNLTVWELNDGPEIMNGKITLSERTLDRFEELFGDILSVWERSPFLFGHDSRS